MRLGVGSILLTFYDYGNGMSFIKNRRTGKKHIYGKMPVGRKRDNVREYSLKRMADGKVRKTTMINTALAKYSRRINKIKRYVG